MIQPESPKGSGTTVGDLIPGYPKEEESMNHRTVKTPESAVTSLARPNGSLVPPRPSAHVPLGPALPRPTAEGRLRLARRLEGDSASPDGWRVTPPHPTAGGRLRLARRLGSASPDPQGVRSASLNPRGLGSAPFDGRGMTPPHRRLGSASPDPQGMRTASLNHRGLGSAPFDGRGTTPLHPTGKN